MVGFDTRLVTDGMKNASAVIRGVSSDNDPRGSPEELELGGVEEVLVEAILPKA
jgi:hypothetical protein